jgi:hypothetical protein
MKLNCGNGLLFTKMFIPTSRTFWEHGNVEGENQYQKPLDGHGKPHPKMMGNWFDIVNHVNFMIVNGNWPI